MDKKTFWIIGAGGFGKRAVERLIKKYPEARITLVDKEPEALTRMDALGVHGVCSEGLQFVKKNIERRPDWIIPAVPIHLALEWVMMKMEGQGASLCPVPNDLESSFPNPVRGLDGQLYLSYADFVCPDNCREPYDRCTFTGKPRKGLLYKKLEELSTAHMCSVVIQSRQLAPGVGGYRPEDLDNGLDQVMACKSPLVLFSTACFCHGVVHAISLI